MVLPLSGPLTLQDIANEFGGTIPHSLSEYYRNGGLVTSNNTSVPTSGAISISNFYGGLNEIIVTATNAASLNLSTAFGANWGVNVPKRLIVPSGVTLGPVTAPSGMSGTLIVENAGEIQGLGGTAGTAGVGGAGGNAITANQSFTLINSGAVRGGGGGGGKGGDGGTGRTTVFAGSSTCQCTCSVGGCPGTGSCGASCGPPGEGCQTRTCNPVYDFWTGGAGGAGGRGTGYGQTLAAGSAGSAGQPNAGNGGAGGTGSTWATAGVTGTTGSNGNFTNGLAGSGGGAAGRAVLMVSGTVSVTNTGTINGLF